MSDVRLIDANALDFALVDEYITDKSQTAALTGKGRCIFNAAIDIARCRVGDAETVDAVPVVHGRWIEKQSSIPWCEDDVEVYYECSVCRNTFCCETNYCDNCGAKMDGGAE